MTTLTNGTPTPCCIASNLTDETVQQLGEPDHYLVLDTCCPGQSWTLYRMEAGVNGYRALWEIPASSSPINTAIARHCVADPHQEQCAYSEPQHWGEVDGVPMPEPTLLVSLTVVVILFGVIPRWFRYA